MQVLPLVYLIMAAAPHTDDVAPGMLTLLWLVWAALNVLEVYIAYQTHQVKRHIQRKATGVH